MDELLALAARAARLAGKAVIERYGDTQSTQKKDASPVTEADLAANDVLMRELGKSGHTILSEEVLEVSLPYPDLLWVIDPLDGTVGFIEKTGDFSIMIALLKNGRPVVSAVYAPFYDKLYTAQAGGGAFLTDSRGARKLAMSTRTLPHLRAVMSRSHSQPYMDRVLAELNVRESIRIGSVGVKAGVIAEDQGDFYFTKGALGEWDVCAPELIAREAGGKVTDILGNDLVYGNPDYRIQNGIVISNGVCHDSLISALRE